jgi:murein DD-endopeptidase MepM/ murein hydrolase activator NlpD
MSPVRSFGSVCLATLLLLSLQPVWALSLPERVQQGQLVIGRTEPGSRVTLDDRALRIDESGRFAFGIGRDQSAAVRVVSTHPDGTKRSVALDILPRQWRIERVDGLPPQTVTPEPEIAARIAREQAMVKEARSLDDARSDFAHGFQRPVEGGRISGVYGSQRILNSEPRAPHMGLDIAMPTGTPVVAAAPGIVSLAQSDLVLTGGTLLIDHGHGISSSYLHLSRIDVSTGQRVEAGETIGAVGATGRASGPHLHWGLNWFETRLDPALLIE